MSMDLNREQKRSLKKMGQLDEKGNPTRQAPTRRTKDERTSPAQYLREVKEEMNKVAWPKWPEIRKYSLVVLVTVVLFTAVIGGADTLFGFLTDWLYEN
ncbi:MAG: preprotein translocase subunit SecE [Actinomycetota bacterium]|nr:preprotein translocase subunit SecE [Actinomycetota bacterium]MDA2972668.1 preprotein translocase subunit SecE [Actinomycetota bacterium]MDA3002145.1 preprotein translocase subunit SecE [Actinomycetota bacterium]